MVVTDLATLVWSPHGHPEAVDALLDMAQIVLIDSVNEPDPAAAVRRAKQLAARAYIVDLAWLRSTPWRERVASTFDPAQWRPELAKISAVTARHRPDSTRGRAAVLRLAGQAPGLGVRQHGGPGRRDARLGARAPAGRPAAAGARPDHERAGAGRRDHRHGLGHAASSSIAAPAGSRRGGGPADGSESEWTVMGASRGEAGILGEGIRQALLRDKAYGPALNAAETMVS